MLLSSTICALATPSGEGAIAVVRVSGEKAFPIVDAIFRNNNRQQTIADFGSHTVHFGHIVDGETFLDEVLVSVFRAPRSYTGEDSVEISCHGSTYIQKRLIELLIQAGASLAQPGEFTLRAFLNGKIDLAQAEGVGDLISSKTEAANKLAIKQLKGNLSNDIRQLREKLLHFLSLIELELDFGEEDVSFANRSELQQLAKNISDYVEELLSSFALGNAIKNGYPITITGKPNVGKSTLLNLLLQEDKAIVTDIPGTTRDLIEDTLTIDGFLFRLIDTAGIRTTNNQIESIGIEKTYASIEKARLILYITDATQPQKAFIDTFLELQARNKQAKNLVIINKIDALASSDKLDNIVAQWQAYSPNLLPLSAKKTTYRTLLQEKIITLSGLQDSSHKTIIANTRHYEALLRVNESMQAIQEGLKNDIPQDLLTQDIKQAMHYLGLIAGEISPDDVLQTIFKNFCIGK